MVDYSKHILARMVDGFSADVEAVQAGVIDGRTPAPARTVLAAALVYVADPVDLMPDHLEGMGLIDDAAMLRIAARAAARAGAADPALRRLALEAEELILVFGDLVDLLEAHLTGRTGPDARGRTPDHIINDSEGRVELWNALNKRREGFSKHALVVQAMDPADVIRTLQPLVRARLAKAGLTAK